MHTKMAIREHIAFMRRSNRAEGTMYVRRRKLEDFDAAVGLDDATTGAIEDFLDARQGRYGGPLSAQARRDWIGHLHAFYQWAIGGGFIDHDPTIRVAKPKIPHRLPRPIDTDDLWYAIDRADPRMRAWLMLAAFAGFRCSDIAALRGEGIDFKQNALRVVGKGNKERRVPMGPQVRQALAALDLPRRGPLFFHTNPVDEVTRPVSAARVSHEIGNFLRSVDVDATAHQLRHWFGTQTFAGSGDLRVTQELMGHASPATTAVYADWSREAAVDVINQIGMREAG